MDSSPGVKKKIKELAGDSVYDESGNLNRKKFAPLLFADPSLRREVNKLVHGAVRDDISNWITEAPGNVFVETAIGAESGIAANAEEVWLVVAETDVRLSRVKCRDRRSEEEIMNIMSAQELEEQKLKEIGVPIIRLHNNPSDRLMPRINELLLKF